jgi:N6-L-threonylcarbamoyladenine synthase
MNVLGIETSCDETGVAIINSSGQILADRLYSQVNEHAQYGGVVPELASRDHIRKITPMIRGCLEDADLRLDQIDTIAYTAGPGLVGALFVGASVAQAMAWAAKIPAIAIHHMEAHLLVPLLDGQTQFPFLCLLVSGGHTMIVKASQLGDYEILGESRDDAVGEAFDKVAQQMELGYPGGPAIEKLARTSKLDLPAFPRPMLDHPSLDFSFSGLKTHTLLAYKDSEQDTPAKAAIASAFQQAVIDTLYEKCRRALKNSGLKTLVVAGGVSANQALRTKFAEYSHEGVKAIFPDMKLCTDNGVMIAHAGLLRSLHNHSSMQKEIKVLPRWSMQTLNAIG